MARPQDERHERLDAVAHDVVRELNLFERFMADSGPGSWREGAKVISLALVDLTERIHAAISLRLQQTQAIAALLRRARDLAEGGEVATQRARQYLWNASGAIHAATLGAARPLQRRSGAAGPLAGASWRLAVAAGGRGDLAEVAAPAPASATAAAPPPALTLAEDWDPGDDPRVRQLRGCARPADRAADRGWLGGAASRSAFVRRAAFAGVVPLAATR